MSQNPPTVLIIDDEPSISRVLGMLLRRAGYNALTAGDGENGYEMALAESPLLILCDERMPGMSGDATLRKLKTNPRTARIPVIMMGGSDSDGLRDWPREGAVGFVAKPFQMPEVLALIRKAVFEDRTPAR